MGMKLYDDDCPYCQVRKAKDDLKDMTERWHKELSSPWPASNSRSPHDGMIISANGKQYKLAEVVTDDQKDVGA